jgi:hypothetical protein
VQSAPEEVGGFEVVLYTAIDERHSPTGRASLSVAGATGGPVAGLAICKDIGEAAYYLFYCDEDWDPLTDSWHETLDGAKDQAEREFEGVSDTWEEPEAPDAG